MFYPKRRLITFHFPRPTKPQQAQTSKRGPSTSPKETHEWLWAAPSRGFVLATKPAAKVAIKNPTHACRLKPGGKKRAKKEKSSKVHGGATAVERFPPQSARRSIQPNQNSQVHKRIHHVRSEQRVDVVMTEVFGKTGPA